MEKKDPIGWIIFAPADEVMQQFLGDIAQAVRLSYRGIVEAGLRNPETDFDPADYFGYVLPVSIPADWSNKTRAEMYAFGLAHKDQRPIFDGDDGGRSAHRLSLHQILDASARMVCLDVEDLEKAKGTYPMRVHQSKKWTGLKGWFGGEMKIPNQGSLVRYITKYLIMTPAITDDAASEHTADLIKRLQGGN